MDARKEFERGFGKGRVIEIDAPRAGNGQSVSGVTWLNKFRLQPLRWFWLGWIMEGGLNFLIGDPAAGKGLFLADLVARITRGLKLPDGNKAPRTKVLYCAVEENIGGGLLPRLIAAGAVRARVAVFTPPQVEVANDPRRFPVPSRGIASLRAEIVATGARLVILDPLVDFLAPGTDPNNEVSVSVELKPLSRLAEEMKLAFICVRHLNKKTETNGFYRMLGSSAFAQKARVIMQIRQDPGDEDGRILSCEKSNYARKPAALPFRILSGRNKTARIEWGSALDREAEEAAAEAEGVTQTKLDEACKQVKTLLAAGPADAEAVQRAMRATGVADRTRWRAYKKLGVTKVATRDEKTGEIVKWKLSMS
jgi:putative DNA primase/helicase